MFLEATITAILAVLFMFCLTVTGSIALQLAPKHLLIAPSRPSDKL